MSKKNPFTICAPEIWAQADETAKQAALDELDRRVKKACKRLGAHPPPIA